MKTFDNKGNHFFIEIIPDINDKGALSNGMCINIFDGRRPHIQKKNI